MFVSSGDLALADETAHLDVQRTYNLQSQRPTPANTTD